MQWHLVVVLVSLLAAWLLNSLAAWQTLARLREPAASRVPKEFAGILDAAVYRKSQAYTRARAGFGLWEDTAATAALIAFILLGGFAWADAAASGFVARLLPGLAGTGLAIARGLAFFALLGLLADLAALPFNVYATLVIEERFGFNRTTVRTYIADKLKGYALAALLGGPLLAAVLLFFLRLGGAAWLWAWAAATAFSLVVSYLAPTLILPLFNRFTPLPPGELRSAMEDYARRVGFALSGIYLMDGSRRSAKSNAFFTGLGRKKRIALFDTLLERHGTNEVVAILAHEVGHDKLGHVRKMLAISVLKTGVVFWLMSLFLGSPGLYAAFGLTGELPVHAGLVFFLLLYTPVSLALSVAFNAMSRRFEFQADAFAAQSTGDGRALAAALKKLSRDNLANLTPARLQVLLHASHPPVLERVRALTG